jgi:hypothetical protein
MARTDAWEMTPYLVTHSTNKKAMAERWALGYISCCCSATSQGSAPECMHQAPTGMGHAFRPRLPWRRHIKEKSPSAIGAAPSVLSSSVGGCLFVVLSPALTHLLSNRSWHPRTAALQPLRGRWSFSGCAAFGCTRQYFHPQHSGRGQSRPSLISTCARVPVDVLAELHRDVQSLLQIP